MSEKFNVFIDVVKVEIIIVEIVCFGLISFLCGENNCL